jgi:hypothetical protein
MTYGIENWKKHLINAIDTQGFENCEYYTNSDNDSDLLKFAYNRFMSEKGWQVEREGITQAVNDWLSGLALNVVFYNHEILKLGKEWGEINETPSEAREDIFINNWWDNLTGVLINLWKKEGII